MRSLLAVASVALLLGCAQKSPTVSSGSAMLQALKGQTCQSGNTNQLNLIYTIDQQKNGQWMVHDVFGSQGTPEAYMRDVGWLPASVDVASLVFQGESALIRLTPIDTHTVQADFSSTAAGRGLSTATLTCTPAPPEKRLPVA